jgi:DNA-directed RNA polymerase I, II, and III subunit RPABC2
MILDEEEQEPEQEPEPEQDQDHDQDQDPDLIQDPALLLKSYKTQKNITGVDSLNPDIPDSPEGSDAENLDSDKSEELDFISGSEDNELDNDEATLTQNSQFANSSLSPPDSEVESDDDDDLQKIEQDQVLSYINRFHSECLVSSSDQVEALSKVIRVNNVIVDANHKTNPILSKYEKTKILGQRTKQLNSGCVPYIVVPSDIIDNYLIAQMELKAKKIPVIIRRPVSSNHSEYWKLEDLEQVY